MVKRIILISTLTVMILTSLITPVLAQGLFDKECPDCHGTGEVTCPNCDGSGRITTTQECAFCQGAGEIQPEITLKDMNGWGYLKGLTDWVARVEGIFHNEEDEGTYGVAKAEVHTVTTTYYDTSPRTYLPPHQDVTITIDIEEITFGEDWTYTIYMSSVDDITCPECGGTGAKSVITDCPNCEGTGNIICSTCNGSGYVTNWMTIGMVGVVAVVIIVGVTAFALTRRKEPTPPITPETKTS